MHRMLSLLLTAGLAASPTLAQDNDTDEILIPVNLRVTITHYDGDELLNRDTHSLHHTANRLRLTELRQGREVPVRVRSDEGVTTTQYRNVGTNIQCRVRTHGERFLVELDLEQSDFADERQSDTPSFHTFNIHQELVLADGERVEVVGAASPGSSERWTVEVELSVVE